jgi:hypothetical protein
MKPPVRKSGKLRTKAARVRHAPERRAEETDFKGPNVKKKHRKPDEIYGDTSIPDSERKE